MISREEFKKLAAGNLMIQKNYQAQRGEIDAYVEGAIFAWDFVNAKAREDMVNRFKDGVNQDERKSNSTT